MIIRQTTTIVFEYPQDYLQEQEWCKTKEDRWIHKGTDTLGAVYENQISYSIGVSADRKTENSSEKPNNCETCKFELYCPEMCEGCCEWDSHYEPKDEPQTDKGIGGCSRCEGRFDCYDRDMPHAVRCNNYGKVTDEKE